MLSIVLGFRTPQAQKELRKVELCCGELSARSEKAVLASRAH